MEQAESSVNRFSAEMSNPADEIAKVASDFWTPKTLSASLAKPKTAGASAKPGTEVKNPTEKPRK